MPRKLSRLYFLRPARGGAAAVVIVFSVLFTVAMSAGLPGIPLAFILTSWFFKYAYVLFDHIVQGHDEPPTLDISMVNPLNEQRPLGQLLIVLLLGAGIYFIASHGWVTLAWALGILAALFFPASVAVLGLDSNILKAVYPVALLRMISGLGPWYFAVLGLIVGVAAAVKLLAFLDLWMPVQFALSLFALLALFSSLAGALYERRDELGLETWHSPERTAAKELAADQRTNDRIVTDAYGQVRAGNHTQAWAALQQWLTSRGHAPEDYRWLIDRVFPWTDTRYVTRLTEDYLDRLLAAKRNGEALDAVVRRLRADPTFRPKTASATLRLAELAAQGGGASGTARLLLSDFDSRFAGDPLAPRAAEMALRLGR